MLQWLVKKILILKSVREFSLYFLILRFQIKSHRFQYLVRIMQNYYTWELYNFCFDNFLNRTYDYVDNDMQHERKSQCLFIQFLLKLAYFVVTPVRHLHKITPCIFLGNIKYVKFKILFVSLQVMRCYSLRTFKWYPLWLFLMGIDIAEDLISKEF